MMVPSSVSTIFSSLYGSFEDEDNLDCVNVTAFWRPVDGNLSLVNASPIIFCSNNGIN